MALSLGNVDCECCNPCDICGDAMVPESITVVMSGWIDAERELMDDCGPPFGYGDYVISPSSSLNTSIVCDLVPEWSFTNDACGCVAVYYGEMTYGDYLVAQNSDCPSYTEYTLDSNWQRGPNTIGFYVAVTIGRDDTEVAVELRTTLDVPDDITHTPATCENDPLSAAICTSFLGKTFFCSGGTSDDALADTLAGFEPSDIYSYDDADSPGGVFGIATVPETPSPTTFYYTASAGRVTL